LYYVYIVALDTSTYSFIRGYKCFGGNTAPTFRAWYRDSTIFITQIQNYKVPLLRRPQCGSTSPSEPKKIYYVIWIHCYCCRMSTSFYFSLSFSLSLSTTPPSLTINIYIYSSKKLCFHFLHDSMINCRDLSNKMYKNGKQAWSYINTSGWLVFMFYDSGEIVRRGDPVPEQHSAGRHGSLLVYREQRHPAPRQQALRSSGSVWVDVITVSLV
jgi:hypothetical protein